VLVTVVVHLLDALLQKVSAKGVGHQLEVSLQEASVTAVVVESL